MIPRERAEALILEHVQLRKLAFQAASQALAPYFTEAKESFGTLKTASESARFDPALRRHQIEP